MQQYNVQCPSVIRSSMSFANACMVKPILSQSFVQQHSKRFTSKSSPSSTIFATHWFSKDFSSAQNTRSSKETLSVDEFRAYSVAKCSLGSKSTSWNTLTRLNSKLIMTCLASLGHNLPSAWLFLKIRLGRKETDGHINGWLLFTKVISHAEQAYFHDVRQ